MGVKRNPLALHHLAPWTYLAPGAQTYLAPGAQTYLAPGARTYLALGAWTYLAPRIHAIKSRDRKMLGDEMYRVPRRRISQ